MSNSPIIKSLWPWVKFSVQLFGGILGALVVGLYFNQDRILYIPNPPGFPKTTDENPQFWKNPGEWTIRGHPRKESAAAAGIPYENVYLTTEDGEKIHCWLLLQPRISNNVPTLVYFHGNAGNMGFRLKNAAEMYAKTGINILMVDYRGYGSSTGTPSEAGLNKDGDAVMKYLVHNKMLKGSPLVMFGRSLGGALAVSIAHRYPEDVQGIIVENTFLSISGMVDKLMPYICLLKYPILRIKWDSDAKIQTLSQPILFISGDSDELVPPTHMKALYDLAKKSTHRDFYSVLGGHHNDTWDVAGRAYYERMAAFFEKVLDYYAEKTGSDRDNLLSKQDGQYDVDAVVDAADVKANIPTMTTDFTVN